MQQYSFDAQSIKETEFVFPPEIESNTQIFYHGTSCIFSPQIEERGFDINYRPWSVEDLKKIADAIKNIDREMSANINRWADTPVKLSLAKKSSIACQHAVASRGGQTLGFIRRFLHIPDIIPEHLSTLLNEASTQDSCVYAISLSNLTSSDYDLVPGTCYMNISIPRELIVGKVVIPKEVQLTDIKKPSLEDIYENMMAR